MKTKEVTFTVGIDCDDNVFEGLIYVEDSATEEEIHEEVHNYIMSNIHWSIDGEDE